MLGHIVDREAHGTRNLPPARRLSCGDGAIICDVLHDPLLTIRHPEGGVVLAGLDQVTPTDAETVAPDGSGGVVNEATPSSFVSNAVIEPCRLIVRGDRDSVAVSALLSDVLAHLVAARVQPYQPK